MARAASPLRYCMYELHICRDLASQAALALTIYAMNLARSPTHLVDEVDDDVEESVRRCHVQRAPAQKRSEGGTGHCREAVVRMEEQIRCDDEWLVQARRESGPAVVVTLVDVDAARDESAHGLREDEYLGCQSCEEIR
eukprot:3326134-Pleurochrysis_carterae.AAC.3